MSACKKHKKKNDENCAMNSLLKRRHAIAGTPSPLLLPPPSPSDWPKNFIQFKSVSWTNSMFAAPDSIEGKVGVTNSGTSMTEYHSRKRSFQSL